MRQQQTKYYERSISPPKKVRRKRRVVSLLQLRNIYGRESRGRSTSSFSREKEGGVHQGREVSLRINPSDSLAKLRAADKESIVLTRSTTGIAM